MCSQPSQPTCVRRWRVSDEDLHSGPDDRTARVQLPGILRDRRNRAVAVLNDRTQAAREAARADDGTVPNRVPLTLRRFRERIEGEPDLFDEFDFGGCGCFTEDGAA